MPVQFHLGADVLIPRLSDLRGIRDRCPHGVALDRFVREVQTDVWRFAAYLTRPEDSDDLAQEAMFRVSKNLHRWERSPICSGSSASRATSVA